MFNYVFISLKNYKISYLKNDIVAGLIVAALTIPVSMGFAIVAGLPMVYGLYGCIFPVITYAMFVSSPQLLYGVDAAASAITGSIILAFGFRPGSAEAISAIPVLTLIAGLFILLFGVLRLGRFAGYIAKPVMSGYLSGLGVMLVVGQFPKIAEINGGSNFLGDLAAIFTHLSQIHFLSLALGTITIILILVLKKYMSRLPAALLILILSTVICAILRLDLKGVSIVGEIETGLPSFSIPDFLHFPDLKQAFINGFFIAVIVYADSLLASNSFAMKNNYKVNNNRDLFAFGASNVTAALFGIPPMSSAISRTIASEQCHGKTQMVSLVSAAICTLVALFFSSYLYYMPQPVLGGIVAAAMLGLIDVKGAKFLFKHFRKDFYIWLVSALGVLLFDVLTGVLIGIAMSFIIILSNSVSPAQSYLGEIPGKDGYYDLKRFKEAKKLGGITIYKFGAGLYFANISVFKSGIAEALKENPKTIILDASAIMGVDTSGAEGLREILAELKENSVDIYFAGCASGFADKMRSIGIKEFEENERFFGTVKEAVTGR